jgi:hypothetical protein
MTPRLSQLRQPNVRRRGPVDARANDEGIRMGPVVQAGCAIATTGAGASPVWRGPDAGRSPPER